VIKTEKDSIMDTTTNTSDNIITRSYEEYYQEILSYITYRITHRYEAEDLTQDVFVRLLDYKQMLRPDTVKYFLFTIARNIVTDYIRRYYKKQEIDSYMYNFAVTSSNETEETIIADDLVSVEQRKLALFPEQRRIVYTLNRYEDKSSAEIAEEMQLSRRTVENHLFIGRREMREFFRKCI
jgi:RNA polymerase sigma-70 factor (ECF subfamily)